MAQIKKIEWDNIPQFKPVTIGHNRQVWREDDKLCCALHGHTIAIFRKADNGAFDACFNPCGYLTRTTCAAMQDFAKFLGLRCGVSRAKGQFKLRYELKRDVYAEQLPEFGCIHVHFPKIDRFSHCVVIGDCFPKIAAIKTTSQYSAIIAAGHLRNMFPHLSYCVEVVEVENMQGETHVPANNAVKDCCTAYIVTGNGAGKPALGSVELWKGF